MATFLVHTNGVQRLNNSNGKNAVLIDAADAGAAVTAAVALSAGETKITSEWTATAVSSIAGAPIMIEGAPIVGGYPGRGA